MNGPNLAQLVRSRRVLVCIGGGGVGKTTIAAALGVAGALAGRRTVVLTIDPAYRLVDALGLPALAAEPQRVALRAAGQLDAMRLDQKLAWDRLVTRHAPSPEAAGRLMGNRFYRELSQSFAGTHEYLAIEALCALIEAGAHDLLVLDTPPADQAFAFLEAPARIRGLLDDRVVRWLLGGLRPGRTLFRVGRATRAVLHRLEDATGTRALADLSDFFSALSSLFGAFDARARQVEDLLHDPATAILLVAAPDERSVATGHALAARLAAIQMRPAAVVLNRLHAADIDVTGIAPAPAQIVAALAAAGVDGPAAWIADNYLAYRRLAAGEARRGAALAETAPGAIVVGVPNLPADVHDLDALGQLARRLAG